MPSRSWKPTVSGKNSPVRFTRNSCSRRRMPKISARCTAEAKMMISYPIRSSSSVGTYGVLPPCVTMLISRGASIASATRLISSMVCGASTKMTSAPASRHALPRAIASSSPMPARASVRAMITKSASRRCTGSLDLFHELPPLHHLFAFIVTTTLWRHLILDMDTSGADRFHLAYGTHQIDGIAIAGVSIGQDRYRYRFTDHLDACHLLIQRNESNVWHTCAPGNAAAGDIHSLETRLLNQYCREPVPCPRQD